MSNTLNCLIGHVAPGLECATVSSGQRKLASMKKYIETIGMPEIPEYSFFYNSSVKALLLHLQAFSSEAEQRIKFAVKRDGALADSLKYAKKELLEKTFMEKCHLFFHYTFAKKMELSKKERVQGQEKNFFHYVVNSYRFHFKIQIPLLLSISSHVSPIGQMKVVQILTYLGGLDSFLRHAYLPSVLLEYHCPNICSNV